MPTDWLQHGHRRDLGRAEWKFTMTAFDPPPDASEEREGPAIKETSPKPRAHILSHWGIPSQK